MRSTKNEQLSTLVFRGGVSVVPRQCSFLFPLFLEGRVSLEGHRPGSLIWNQPVQRNTTWFPNVEPLKERKLFLFVGEVPCLGGYQRKRALFSDGPLSSGSSWLRVDLHHVSHLLKTRGLMKVSKGQSQP